ncbi:MAG: hypothetical protein JW751_21035 [Polyangiaceae bacterium]|nr:hypothetical protein [Polyangiaceae bacterium]
MPAGSTAPARPGLGLAHVAGASDPADAAVPEAKPDQLDPDGDDDAVPCGEGPLPAHAHFEKVGKAPLALRQICDLAPLGDALYAAHALVPLGADGATITRYRPSDEEKPFTVAFNWNRPGEPTKGGGAGQGFLRVHLIDGRLFVPDADPPYNGFGISDFGTEGYVFVSNPSGGFAGARRPHQRPPAAPSPEGQAGSSVLPRAYHVLDVIRFRGRLYASTGSVPPEEHAWRGPSPGALHVANADWSRWTYEVDYPYPWLDGVWRLTFLARFRDRLYAGIQDYDGREPNDYVVFGPARDSSAIEHEDVHAVRVTAAGAAQTLRWYADSGRLYWIAWGRDGVRLRVTRDGDHWTVIPLPPEAGAPTDITRFRGSLVVLTERALLSLSDAGPVVIATVDAKKSPFELRDILCGAPLAVFGNELYAGGQRQGELYKLVADEP